MIARTLATLSNAFLAMALGMFAVAVLAWMFPVTSEARFISTASVVVLIISAISLRLVIPDSRRAAH